jgi:hypothetical protein
VVPAAFLDYEDEIPRIELKVDHIDASKGVRTISSLIHNFHPWL